MNKNLFRVRMVIVWPLLGLVFFSVGWYASLRVHTYGEEKCLHGYDFINAEPICFGRKPVIHKANYSRLRKEMEVYVSELQQKDEVGHVSVYFRDLVNGPVFGVNETEDFAPASLLKVPLSFVYLNLEQENPGFLKSLPKLQYLSPTTTPRTLEEKIKSPALKNLNQVFAPPHIIEPNTPYEIEELLFRLLAYSDNISLDLLATYAEENLGGVSAIHEVFREMGLTEGGNISDETVSVRAYASIFRSLFHSSYLNAELSEKVLSWLSQSSFVEGLRAGVPAEIRIAHKFGERDWSKTNTHQLHDCGIVYFPGNPYLLCVMTQGKSSKVLAPVIARISRMVYVEVNSRKLNSR